MTLSCAEMKALEQRVFATGVAPEALMDEAGEQIAGAVRQFFPTPGICLAFFGKGHNGGDALVAARHMGEAGWTVFLVAAFPEDQWSDLTRKKFWEAGRCQPHFPATLAPRPGRPIVVLDGLLGVGTAGALREPIRHFTRTINSLAHSVDAKIFAIDLPTGLDGDSGTSDPDCVRASFTLAVGFAKTGLVADAAINQVGRLAVLPLSPLTAARAHCGTDQIATPIELAALLPLRAFDSHKGDFGRIGIIAGSRGFTGAAVMAASACVHAGGGLITLFVPEEIQSTLAASVAPEVMVKPVKSYLEAFQSGCDAIALGPGLGQQHSEEVVEIIRVCESPMIVDADGLNIIAKNPDLLNYCAGPRLLTPHPGEMARLDPESKERSRKSTVESFTKSHRVTLLLKGARTVIGEKGRSLSYNTTGNPGMASGGMGDVLTGVCAALAGQRLPLYDVARLGAWICGRAGERAVSYGSDSEESLSATRLIGELGGAFRDLRARCF